VTRRLRDDPERPEGSAVVRILVLDRLSHTVPAGIFYSATFATLNQDSPMTL